jgi:hypothetical protein
MADQVKELPVGTIQATGTDDYTATIQANRATGVPLLVIFEHANTHAVSLNKVPVRQRAGGKVVDLPTGTLDPTIVYELDDAGGQYLLGASTNPSIQPAKAEPKRFQVRFKDGGGEQFIGDNPDAIREGRAKFWGDREILSVEELKQ